METKIEKLPENIVKVDIVQDCITLLNGETEPAEE